MAKRAASKQLTQDNWNDDDEEKETPGVYKSVDASVLQNRVIKKAKRTLPKPPEKHGLNPSDELPFGVFRGFGKKTESSMPSLGFLKNICEKSVPQAVNADSPEGKKNGPNPLKPDVSEKAASGKTQKSELSALIASPTLKSDLSAKIAAASTLKLDLSEKTASPLLKSGLSATSPTLKLDLAAKTAPTPSVDAELYAKIASSPILRSLFSELAEQVASAQTPKSDLSAMTPPVPTLKSDISTVTASAQTLKSGLPEKTASAPTMKNSDESSLHSAKDFGNVKKPRSRDVQYYRHLKALNEGVLQWVQMHTERNPWCDLTPVFNDYRKHINTIDQKFPLKEKQSPSQKVLKPFSFKVPPAPTQKVCNSVAEEKLSSSDPDTKMARKSSGSDTESTEMLYGAGFKSSTTNTSTFSFGIKATTTATVPSSNSGPTSSCGSSEKEKTENVKSPFSFGVVAKSAESSCFSKMFTKVESKPFSFAVSPMASKDPAIQQNNGMNEDEEYVPPKPETVNIKEEGSVYSKRCKLFYKSDGTYKEKGVGTLYLKPADGNIQLLIRADTVTGKILLNIKLVSSLPMQRVGKNNVLVSCVPNPPIGPDNSDAKEPVSFLIRTKTGDDADELFGKLNKYKS